MAKSHQKMGRLAFRVEGENWNVYYAELETMQDAIYMGSIKMSLVTRSIERKDQFISLMRDCFADVCEELFGTRPQLEGPIRAPEHERSGEA